MAVAGNYPAEQALTFVRGVQDMSAYIDLARLQAERSNQAVMRARQRLDAMGLRFDTEVYWRELGRGNADVVRHFVEAGVSPDLRNEKGQSGLVAAVVLGFPKIAQTLLTLGAEPDLPLSDNTTALMIAAGDGDLDLVQNLIARGANVNARRRNYYETPLQIGVWGLDDRAVGEQRFRDNRSITDAYVGVVRALVCAGSDLNVTDRSKNNIIESARYVAMVDKDSRGDSNARKILALLVLVGAKVDKYSYQIDGLRVRSPLDENTRNLMENLSRQDQVKARTELCGMDWKQTLERHVESALKAR